MICPKCGKDAGEAKFCPECGEALEIKSKNTICPKCGKDAGEAKFCPECGENLSAPSENETKTEIVQENKTVAKPKKKIKKIWVFLAIIVVIIAFVGIKSAVNHAKENAPEAQATYVDWSTIYSDYKANGQTAEEKYASQKNLFYVRIDDIDSFNARVTFFDQDWNSPSVQFSGTNSVYFKDYSEIHTGGLYVIEGTITLVWTTPSKLNWISNVSISGAKVISEK